jgi:hypothetical protein
MNAKMGMDLSGKGGYFRFSIHRWRAALGLAHEHGWEPAGTKPPEFTVYAPDGVTVDEVRTRVERQRYADWDGDYFYNDGRLVTDEDARNIADALERALDLVPEEGNFAKPLLTATQWQALVHGELSDEEISEALDRYVKHQAECPPQIPPQTPAYYFAGQKDYLREFITFCRAGGFSIG